MKCVFCTDRRMRPFGVAQRRYRARALGRAARFPGPGDRREADGHG